MKLEVNPMGIVRKVDPLGRVVIPMETRKALNWETGTPVEMFATKEGIFIRTYKAGDEKKTNNES